MLAESFDHYTDAKNFSTGVASRWIRYTTTASSNDEDIVPGRFGGQALRIARDGAVNAAALYFLLAVEDTPAPEFRMSFAFQRSVGNHDPRFLGVSLTRGTDRIIGLKFLRDGSIQIGTGGPLAHTSEPMTTILGTTDAGVFMPETWHTCNVRGLIHPTDGFIHLVIDGEGYEYSLEGVNTEGVSGEPNITDLAVSCNGFGPGGSGNADLVGYLSLDDMVLELGVNDTQLPECRIQSFLPVADGSHLDLVPSAGADHYAVVDEAVVNTSDYLSGTLDGEYDLLECADLSVVPGSILAVQAVGWASKTDAATRAWQLGIVSGATTSNGSQQALTDSPTPIHRLWQLNPDSGLVWDQAAINALELKPTIVVP